MRIPLHPPLSPRAGPIQDVSLIQDLNHIWPNSNAVLVLLAILLICLLLISHSNRSMANNPGVDAKPIISPSQMKNMWEQNILKKKQELEQGQKVVGQNNPPSPVKSPQTKSVVEQPSQPVRNTETVSNYTAQRTVNTVKPQQPTISTNPKMVQPIKIAQKTQSSIDTTGMSLKQRMKLWQQASGTKSQGTSSPLVTASEPPPTQTVTKPAETQSKPMTEPIKHIQIPKSNIVVPQVLSTSNSMPAKQPITQTQPPPPSFSSNQESKSGGTDPSFVPVSKRIGMWQTNLHKTNSETKKPKEENELLTKAGSRLSYQPQSSSSQRSDKAPERASYAPESPSDINLQQILEVKQQKPPVDAFSKKPSETQTEGGQRILSVKERMKMMQQSLEKNMKQKQLYTLMKPVPEQPPPRPRVEEVKVLQSEDAEREQVSDPLIESGTPQELLYPKSEDAKEAPITNIQLNAENLGGFQNEAAMQAKMKNRKTKIAFDDA